MSQTVTKLGKVWSTYTMLTTHATDGSYNILLDCRTLLIRMWNSDTELAMSLIQGLYVYGLPRELK